MAWGRMKQQKLKDSLEWETAVIQIGLQEPSVRAVFPGLQIDLQWVLFLLV
jgi:hypothetical protein